MSVVRVFEELFLGLFSLLAFLSDVALKLLAFFTMMLGGYILYLRSQADYGEYLVGQAVLGADARWAFWLDLVGVATTKEALTWVLLWALPVAMIHSLIYTKPLNRISGIDGAAVAAQGGQA